MLLVISALAVVPIYNAGCHLVTGFKIVLSNDPYYCLGRFLIVIELVDPYSVLEFLNPN